jgi:hypothetical protein
MDAKKEIERSITRCDGEIAAATQAVRNKVAALHRYAAEAEESLARGCGASTFACTATNVSRLAIELAQAAAELDQATRFKDQFQTALDFING